MTAPSLSDWIAETLASERLNAQSLITTLLGDSIAPFGGHFWLKSLIRLAEPLGLNERLVRTSVYRLTQDGWLRANRQGRRSEYQLTPEGFSRFEQAHSRIYSTTPEGWDGQWTLLVMQAGVEAAPARLQMRRELAWEGFVALGQGVLGHPSPRRDALAGILHRLGLRDQVFVLAATEIAPLHGRSLQEFAAKAWPLTRLAQDYGRFVQRFSPLLSSLEQARASGQPIPAGPALLARTLLIHALRRVQLRDPQLPAALLPRGWPGAQAYALSARLYRQLHRAADTHVLALLEAESGFVPPLTPYFFQRFGGLLETA
ncbi:PaaX family transcriptional regulator [Paucibacter soli]|uniref:PaaX family transcriptional regulator n=1 Tax=Paucibacter soli TaxID=3133433 RepID=UPI00309DECBD